MTVEFKRNDILVETLGYNMTLYSFYKVVATKGKTVKLIPLQHINKPHGFLQNDVKPIDRNCWLEKEVIIRRYNKYGYIRGKYDNYLHLYNAEKTYTENHAD